MDIMEKMDDLCRIQIEFTENEMSKKARLNQDIHKIIQTITDTISEVQSELLTTYAVEINKITSANDALEKSLLEYSLSPSPENLSTYLYQVTTVNKILKNREHFATRIQKFSTRADNYFVEIKAMLSEFNQQLKSKLSNSVVLDPELPPDDLEMEVLREFVHKVKPPVSFNFVPDPIVKQNYPNPQKTFKHLQTVTLQDQEQILTLFEGEILCCSRVVNFLFTPQIGLYSVCHNKMLQRHEAVPWNPENREEVLLCRVGREKYVVSTHIRDKQIVLLYTYPHKLIGYYENSNPNSYYSTSNKILPLTLIGTNSLLATDNSKYLIYLQSLNEVQRIEMALRGTKDEPQYIKVEVIDNNTIMILKNYGALYTANIQPFTVIANFVRNKSNIKDFVRVSEDIICSLSYDSICFWLWKDASLIREVAFLRQFPDSLFAGQFYKIQRYNVNTLMVNAATNIHFYDLQKELWYPADVEIKIEDEVSRYLTLQASMEPVKPFPVTSSLLGSLPMGGSLIPSFNSGLSSGGSFTSTSIFSNPNPLFQNSEDTRKLFSNTEPPKNPVFLPSDQDTFNLFGGIKNANQSAALANSGNIFDMKPQNLLSAPAITLKPKTLGGYNTAFKLLDVMKDGSLIMEFCINDNTAGKNKKLMIYGPQ
jgi:hypothetical protein